MQPADYTRLVIDARYVRVGRHDGISRYTAGVVGGLTQALTARPDIDVELMVCDPRQLDKLPDFSWFMGPDPVSAKELVTGRMLNKRRADVVFSPMQTMGALRRRFGLILTLHDVIYYDHPEPPTDLPAAVRTGWRLFHKSPWPQRAALDRADAVVTVSETSAEAIRDRELTRRPLFVVPNAADQSTLISPDTVDDLVECRASQPRKLTYVGSFMPYKDVETLIRAASLLPDHELHLVSRISDQRRAQLTELAPTARLVFHNGIDDDAYRSLLRESTALVHASRAEGYGLPLMEALCAGTPVVCSDLPIFREVCADAALYATVGQAGDFAGAVRRLAEPETAAAQITRGLTVARRHTWADSARELLNVVDRVRYQRLRTTGR